MQPPPKKKKSMQLPLKIKVQIFYFAGEYEEQHINNHPT